MVGKWLYCPYCKRCPDRIVEVYEKVKEMRTWDGDCYELVDSDWPEWGDTFCGDCGGKLEMRELGPSEKTARVASAGP